MSFSLVFCLSLAVLGCHGGHLHLVPATGIESLYSNYDGAYAGKFINYEPRSYAYEYGVSDPHTGDHKTQWETKDKDGVVRGSYSLLEPDGSTRIVDYIADGHGFRAVVKKVGLTGHPESIESHGGAVEEPIAVVPIQAPTVVEAPAVGYKSYDGGVHAYSGLKPVVDDIYTKPLDYVHAPRSEQFFINVPDERNVVIPKAQSLNLGVPQEYLSHVPHHDYYVPELKPHTGYYVPKTGYAADDFHAPPQEYHPIEHYPVPHVSKVAVPEYQVPQTLDVPFAPQYQRQQIPYVQKPLSHQNVYVEQPKYYQDTVGIIPDYHQDPNLQYNLNLDYFNNGHHY